MFKDTSYQQASTATLTPTKLVMENPMQHSDWSLNQASINELNSYMTDVGTFNQSSNLFDQKFSQHELLMPLQANKKMASSSSSPSSSPPSPPSHSAQISLTPPSPATENLPRKQRKKLLEKNREAAYRCRQKKKKWVNGLEERSQIAETKNRELQEQVSQLREESIYLRNLLLTHGNCECDVVQAYLRRTSEQLSNTVSLSGHPGNMPNLVESNSSVSGSESSMSPMSKQLRQMYDQQPRNLLTGSIFD